MYESKHDDRLSQGPQLSLRSMQKSRTKNEEVLYYRSNIGHQPNLGKDHEILKQQDHEILKQQTPKFLRHVTLNKQINSFSTKFFFTNQELRSAYYWKTSSGKKRATSSYLEIIPKTMTLIASSDAESLKSASSLLTLRRRSDFELMNDRILIEHVKRNPKIINEAREQIVKEQTLVSEQKVILPSIDMNRLSDQIYELIERKVRIERERRGL